MGILEPLVDVVGRLSFRAKLRITALVFGLPLLVAAGVLLAELNARVSALQEERTAACAGIARLFALFVAHPELLPEWHLERMRTLPVQRVVCDYIAGMTDGFFQRTAARLLGD